GTEQPEHFAGLDAERHAPERRSGAETLADIKNFENRGGHRPHSWGDRRTRPHHDSVTGETCKPSEWIILGLQRQLASSVAEFVRIQRPWRPEFPRIQLHRAVELAQGSFSMGNGSASIARIS